MNFGPTGAELFFCKQGVPFETSQWLLVRAMNSSPPATKYFFTYVNKCGFQIDQFWCEYFKPEHEMFDAEERDFDEGPDEMFRFIKVMK